MIARLHAPRGTLSTENYAGRHENVAPAATGCRLQHAGCISRVSKRRVRDGVCTRCGHGIRHIEHEWLQRSVKIQCHTPTDSHCMASTRTMQSLTQRNASNNNAYFYIHAITPSVAPKIPAPTIHTLIIQCPVGDSGTLCATAGLESIQAVRATMLNVN